MDWTARGSLEEDRRKGPFTSDKSSISCKPFERRTWFVVSRRFPCFFPWSVRRAAEYLGKEEKLRKLEFWNRRNSYFIPALVAVVYQKLVFIRLIRSSAEVPLRLPEKKRIFLTDYVEVSWLDFFKIKRWNTSFLCRCIERCCDLRKFGVVYICI